MATSSRDLLIRLLGDSSGMKKAMADADDAVGKHDLSLKNLAGTIGSAYAATKIIDYSRASIEAAAADEASQVKLATALRNTAGASDEQIAAAEKWIEQTMFATGVTDDELRPALERLTRATGDVGSAQDLLKVAMDASAGTGKSLQAVTDAMGKASDGNVGALGRLGIATKDAEGKTLSFDEVVQNMSQTFSGQAAAAADTQAGKMAIMKARMGELQEQIGAALMPIMEQLVGVLSGVAEWFSNLDEGTQTWIIRIGMLGGGLVLATRAVNGIVGPLKSLGVIGRTASTALDGAATSSGKFASVTGKLSSALAGALTPALLGAGAALATWQALEALGDQSIQGLERHAMELSTVLDSELLKTYGKVVTATLGVAGNTDTLDESVQRMAHTNIEGARRLREYMIATGYMASEIERVTKAIEIEEAATKRADDTHQTYGKTVDDTTKKVATLGYETTFLTDTLGPYKAALDSAKFANEQLNDKLDEAAERYKSITDAVNDYMESERSLYDEQLSRLDAKYAFEAQQRSLTSALQDYNSTANHTVDETDTMAQQIRNAAMAYGTLDGAVAGSKEATDRSIESLYGMATTLAPGSPLRAELLRYIADLQTVPTNVNTLMNLGVKVTGGVATMTGVQYRAGGGDVTAGMPYVVGEKRPELFVPSQNGTIIPRLPAMGGLTVNVTVNNQGSVMAERDLIRTIYDGIIDGQRRGELLVG